MKDLYEKIMNRFDWYDIEDNDRKDLKRALETNDTKYLTDVLDWFKIDYYETKESDDLEIINRLEDILKLEIIKS